jgi:HEPN domain-containing protein
MSGPESNFQAWVSKAENDFLNIENNLQAPLTPWDTVCFHAQKAAEKLLKASLICCGQVPTRTHDLVVLLVRCAEFDDSLKTLEGDCRRLTVYAVGSRYPDDLFEPSKGDALEMVGAARRVRQAVMTRLSQRMS